MNKGGFESLIVSTQMIACQRWLYKIFKISYKHIKGIPDVRLFVAHTRLYEQSFLTSYAAVKQARNGLEMIGWD